MKRSTQASKIARANGVVQDSGANRLRAEIPSLLVVMRIHIQSHRRALSCACAWHGRSGVADSAQENIITIPARPSGV